MADVDLSNDQLRAVLAQHPTQQAAAHSLGISRPALQRLLRRREINPTSAHKPDAPKSPASSGRPATLTRAALHAALQPPNTCRVKQFRETLAGEERDVLDEALGYTHQDFPAAKLRDLLLALGHSDLAVPGTDAINDHRAGRGRCRCKG